MTKYLFLLFGLVTPCTALAVDTTWTGAAGSFWGLSGSWTVKVPNGDDDAFFDGSASEFSVDVGARDRAAALMTIDSAAAYTFTDNNPGQTLSLENVTVLSGTGHSFNVDLVLAAPAASNWSLADGTSLDVNHAISGSSGLTKAGGGVLTLSAANTYSGGTTVSGGTLQIGSGGNSGSITGNVANNANLIFNLSNNLTFADIISGTGNVTQSGSGNLTFSGANTYSGATTIDAGSLIISDGNAGALANSAVTVASGAQLTFDDVNQFEYRIGSVAGAGVIDAGTGTLDVGRDNTSTIFSGAFSLLGTTTSGEVEKNGSGTLTLTGSGHDVGLLDVRSGSVIIDGAAGSFDLVDAQSSTTIRNTENAFAIDELRSFDSMTITGSGTLVETTGDVENFDMLLIEDGATVRPLDEFFQTSGSTTIVDRATLVIPNFGALNEGTIAITDPTGGIALTVGSDSGNSSFAGAIVNHTSGAGSVTKTGNSTVIFSGANNYTGLTTINEGTVLADNFSGSVLNTGGTFSPGESPATTTIGGSYTQQVAGTLLLEIGGTTPGTDYDVLTLGAASDLNGTIEVQLINGYTPVAGDQFTLITSTATITDSGVDYTLPSLATGLEWTVTLDASSLVLEVTVNNPPVADDQTISTDEDTGLTIMLTGSDIEGQPLTFAIASGPSDGSLGTITPISATSAEVSYTPDPDFNGNDSFTFTTNDGSSDSAAATVTITVNSVNDQPDFAAADPAAILEDAGLQTIMNWASFNAGAANETDGVLAYSVTNVSNAALFAVDPTVDPSGTLTFTPADDQFGSSTFDVAVQDDGGNANGGIDTSDPQTFTITVNPVNDAPGFISGGDVTEIEDGDYAEPWASSISPGPANESDQSVTFMTTVTSNPGLFAVGPSIDGSGTLSFTPTADTIGSATIEVFAMDDGLDANGGTDISAPVTFTIDVIAAADLNIDKSSGSFFTDPGGAITYTIVVTNPGPSNVFAARVLDDPPDRLENVTWTCVADTGATCNSGGSDFIDELVILQVGSSVTFTLDAELSDTSNDPITNTASVTAPMDVLELVSANNSDSDTDLIGLFADGLETIEP